MSFPPRGESAVRSATGPEDVRRHRNASMVFTNGDRPYILRNGVRDYNAPFYATYAGSLKFDVTDRNC